MVVIGLTCPHFPHWLALGQSGARSEPLDGRMLLTLPRPAVGTLLLPWPKSPGFGVPLLGGLVVFMSPERGAFVQARVLSPLRRRSLHIPPANGAPASTSCELEG